MNNPLYVDFLARFKNASVAGRKSFFAPLSKVLTKPWLKFLKGINMSKISK